MTAGAEHVQDRVTAWARHQEHAYASDDDPPLGSMLAIMAAYGAVTAALFGATRMSGRELPERFSAADLGLLTVATHKIARLAAKDPVTSPLRAPFTRFAGTSGEAELAEEVRGSGTRKALGEVATCPFCLGQWVATGLVFGLGPGAATDPAHGVGVHGAHRSRRAPTALRQNAVLGHRLRSTTSLAGDLGAWVRNAKHDRLWGEPAISSA